MARADEAETLGTMFEFLEAEPRYRRWGREAFLLVTPLLFILFLLRGHPSLIVVSEEPFWIGNYQPSSLPTFFAEIVSYGYYEGTAAALLLALVCAVVSGRSRRTRTPQPAEVWYLPAFVAGIEAMRHARLLGSRHGFTEMPTFEQLTRDWLAAGAASLSVVVFCALLGVVFARVARARTEFPLVIVPVILSVVGGWYAVLRFVLGLGA